MTSLADDLTVIVTASPIPSMPDTTVIEACLDSVRAYLPDCQVIVCCDGVRPEAWNRREQYDEWSWRLAALISEGRWGQVEVVGYEEWQHQARMIRDALVWVDTPTVLLMEHDTTFEGEIRFDALMDVMHSGKANIVRFHHEAQVLPSHEWLNVNGGAVEQVQGVPLIATAQFSARPHLADTDYYRWLLGPEFIHPDARCFVEDSVWGQILRDWQDAGRPGWDKHRLWIYAEADHNCSIAHSATCDGRQDDPKAPTEALPLEGLS